MADRSIHYEAAFEDFIRQRGLPYVAVDEAKKATFAAASLKSFDFVVYSRSGPNLLVDVKGRQRRNVSGRSASFQTWTTEADVEDLLQWQGVFGEGFRAMIAFVYWIDEPLSPSAGMFEFRGRWYWAFGIELREYQERMRRRSEKWRTVALPMADFRELARPVEQWL